jgi:lysyl-tRNA synthetase class 1
MHWADQYADEVIKQNPNKKEYVVESGITPSGDVHAGNFREVLTQDFVYRALLKRGVRARYQYFWDDWDRFRKVPQGVPASWEEHIGKPNSSVPDPNGCHKSYADHFIEKAVGEAKALGVECSYLRASEEYPKCKFAEEIRMALEKRDTIREVVNEFRKEGHDKGWMPTRVYCEVCEKDNTTHEYLGDYQVHYKCECGHEDTIDFRKKGLVKLVWRADWPMRWKHYGVDFESAGKDHHASGGSWDTCSRISERVYGYAPPISPMYEHIQLGGAKMSKSSGGNVTITDLLEVYEPEIVRYIYTGKINRSLEIPFDFGLSNMYNYYDKTERVYFGKEAVENERELENERRQYELAQTKPEPWAIHVQPDFGFCATVGQVAKTLAEAIALMQQAGQLPDKLTDADKRKAELRLRLAKAWVRDYAPEEVRFTVQEKMPKVDVDEKMKTALSFVAKAVGTAKDKDELAEKIKQACEVSGVETKAFFSTAYRLLLNKERGPRLAGFLMSLDGAFVQNRLNLVK